MKIKKNRVKKIARHELATSRMKFFPLPLVSSQLVLNLNGIFSFSFVMHNVVETLIVLSGMNTDPVVLNPGT